jgi:dTDP-4-amino-4,6-dideoxygalactose transaminase
VHTLTAYGDRLAPHQPELPVTDRAGAEVLSLPFSPAHTDDDIRDAVAALRRVHARLSG